VPLQHFVEYVLSSHKQALREFLGLLCACGLSTFFLDIVRFFIA